LGWISSGINRFAAAAAATPQNTSSTLTLAAVLSDCCKKLVSATITQDWSPLFLRRGKKPSLGAAAAAKKNVVDYACTCKLKREQATT